MTTGVLALPVLSTGAGYTGLLVCRQSISDNSKEFQPDFAVTKFILVNVMQ